MDEFDKKIREIKISRQPEYWLKYIFISVNKKLFENQPDYIFYFDNKNQLLFEYSLKTNYFRFDFNKIYKVLIEKYHCSIIKADELIVKSVEKYLKINNVIPFGDLFVDYK